MSLKPRIERGKTPRIIIATAALIAAASIALTLSMPTPSTPVPSAPTPMLPPASKKLADPKREAAFQRTMAVVKFIKSAQREPSSVQWSSIEANEDASVVCVLYRARNGFGGMNIETATYADGKLTASYMVWQKTCADRTLMNNFLSIRAVI